jgi:hypothetical protein
MDYVYICREGNNEELRYSIRSVVAHASYNNIWLVGYKPDWYLGNFVNLPDTATKFDNIVSCIKTITDVGAISDDFVLMNDDFFFLKDVGKVPIYHGGLLRDKIDKYIELGSRRYATLLSRTYNNLVRQGIKDPLDYDIHVPMPMNKIKLKESIKKAYFPRSGYGNVHNIGGTHIEDVKTYSNKSPLKSNSYDFKNGNMPFVSTEDGSFQEVCDTVLKDMFPNPSQYEVEE